jgi:hypothetical protein
MRLTLQLIVSAALVFGVLFFMWRLPKAGERFFAWAPPLALLSAWGGLVAVIGSGLLWVLPNPDTWVTLLFLVLDPLAIAAGVLVMWIYRGHAEQQGTIEAQQMQAKVGVALGLIAVVLGYVFVMTHRTPDILPSFS